VVSVTTDDHARHLLVHVAAPLIQAVHMQPADTAIRPWRDLTDRDRETVVLLLAAICPPDRDPERQLRWLTDRPRPEHCDEDTEAPPLRVGA